jgi:hypothetical protein
MPSYPEHLKASRMAEDARRIRNVSGWPLVDHLPMKTQPWIAEASGFRHGKIEDNDLRTVHTGGTLETYGSVEELVKTWSVD